MSDIEEIQTLNSIKIKDVFSIKQEITLNNLKDKKEIYIVGENGDGKTLLLQAIAVGLKGTAEDELKAFRAIEETYTIEIDNKELCENNFLFYGTMRNIKSPVDWLLSLDSSILKNVNFIIQTLLDSKIEIVHNQVNLKEKYSIVEFKYLSNGYRSVITIVCDLINRLSQNQDIEEIADFKGIVLIDEVELNLHPKLAYDFMEKLRDAFPLIQFIVTTHSPSVILGASEKAVFYKVYKDEGEVKLYQPMNNIKNLMANALVTSPLFDMNTARAKNSDENLETDEDYIWTKIHENISKRVKSKKAISENDIVAMTNEELDKFLKEKDL